MTGSGATQLLRDLGRVQSLFPRGFNVAAECLRHGVSKIALGPLGVYSKAPGAYDAEEQAVRLCHDLSDLARTQLAAGISRRMGVKVTASDLFVWVLYHELAHHLRRRNLLPMSRRNATLGALGAAEGEAVSMEEHEAEAYAKRKFMEWKRRRA